MLDFFDEPKDTERRTNPNGIYTSYMFGPKKCRVQIILSDTRWNRDPLEKVDDDDYEEFRRPASMGPYVATTNTSKELLGEAQWEWLEQELLKPAKVR